MKLFGVLSASVLIFFGNGCRKQIQKLKEEKLIDIVTNGRWKVVQYLEANKMDTITYIFNNYEFQFFENKKIIAFEGNVEKQTGSFNYDLNARTIVAAFDNATYPLFKLNGTWKIKDSGENYVEAEQTVEGSLHFLELQKKE